MWPPGSTGSKGRGGVQDFWQDPLYDGEARRLQVSLSSAPGLWRGRVLVGEAGHIIRETNPRC